MKILFRLLGTLLLVLLLDGTSKLWAEQALVPYQPVPLLGDVFRLTLGHNTGVAFGMFANGGIWPLLLTGVIIAGLMVWFARTLHAGHFPPGAAWPVGLLLGGAIGNFIDRLPDGRVTDFLDAGIGAARWPTFNLADSFILIGVSVLMLLTFNSHPETKPQPETTPPESNPNRLYP